MKLKLSLALLLISTSALAQPFCERQRELLAIQERSIQTADLDKESREFFEQGLKNNRMNYEVLCEGRIVKTKTFCERQQELLDIQAQRIEDSNLDQESLAFFRESLQKNKANAETLCGDLN